MFQKNEIKESLKKIIPNPGLNFIRNVILKKPRRQILNNLYKFISSPARKRMYLAKLDKIHINAGNVPFEKFSGVSDDFWFWLYTSGYLLRPGLQKIMPSMPEERIQLQYTGISGYRSLEEAFLFYQFIKLKIKQFDVKIQPESKILDFGCGWGRIVRFFLKDLPSASIYGIDCDSEIINICNTTGLNCNFSVNDIYPPTEFEDNRFDVIYSFSVFSHLSEDAHRRWLVEFRRILKPGGILIVTTRSRDFILTCARLRDVKETDVPFFATGPSQSFLDTSMTLEQYDNGNYIYEPIGGGGIRDGSFYGETCIPEKYIRTEWAKYFRHLDFVDYKEHLNFDQNAIIAVK